VTGALPEDRRRVVRLVAAGVVILAFVALAAFAIAASRSDFSVGLPKPTVELDQPTAGLAAPISALRPSGNGTGPSGVAAPAPVALTGTTVAGDGSLSAPPPLETDVIPAAECGLVAGLPTPDVDNGLANLVGIVPLFGSFSPEAFAFIPAFQPLLAAGSPLLPVFEQLIAMGDPVFSVVAPTAQQLGQAGFGVLAPLYGPARQSVLDAEADFAAQIAPILDQLVHAPGSECLYAFEQALADAISPLLPPAH
jgi:hypothetical protein